MSSSTSTKKQKLETNDELANMLIEIGEFEKNVNRQTFKYNAYRKAAQSIKKYPKKITDISEVKNLEGVGKKIKEKICKYLKDGSIKKLEKVRGNEDANHIKELTRVSGIGAAAAQKLVKEGIKSLDDLRKNTDKLTHMQKIGLKYVEDFEKRIPRKEMLEMEEFLLKEIEKIDKDFKVTICGSYRRGLETSGDIDMLLTHPTYVSSSFVKENKATLGQKKNLIVDSKKSPKPLIDKVVNHLVQLKFITDTMAFGETKFIGVCNLKEEPPFRRIDIRLVPHDQYYCGVLYFTGSDMFNKDMRTKALECGYTLNEYSIRKIGSTGIPGKALMVNSEQDIFNYLGMDFKKPEERSL